MAGLFPRKVSKQIAMAEGSENPTKIKKPKKKTGLLHEMAMMQKMK